MMANYNPLYKRSIEWSGYQWRVKNHINQATGPGPNYFSDSQKSVWIDKDGYLHMKLRKETNGVWYSSQIINSKILGFGEYTVQIASDISNIDPDVIVGMFTWDDHDKGGEHHYREIDIEIAKWGDIHNHTNAQYVCQPWEPEGNSKRFKVSTQGETSYTFIWKKTEIKFSTRENGKNINCWTYSGLHVPDVEGGQQTYRINLWAFNPQKKWDGKKGPTFQKDVQVIFKRFNFIAE